MKILAIDTSCDETAVAVTEGRRVLSNIVWSQASLHAKWGGVLPSLAQREHEKRIDWVVKKAMDKSQTTNHKIDAIAVTAGPGLAIALEVGIRKARELAHEWNKPLIPVNHIEGHLLSPLAVSGTTSLPPPNSKNMTDFSLLTSFAVGGGVGEGGISFPALGLVVSGGHTELVYITKIGEYKIIAETQDDALGEALDKAARMLGLGYPGGAFLEKLAREGNPPTAGSGLRLPLPMAGREDQNSFSYSGLKSAMFRLVEKVKVNSKQQTCDLAASFQDMAFKHLMKVMKKSLGTLSVPPPYPPPKSSLRLAANAVGGGVEGGGISQVKDLLVGGGVAANVELRKRLRGLGKEMGLKVWFPYSKKLIGDNAAMIGIAAYFQITNHKPQITIEEVDRRPRWSVEEIT